MTLDYEKIIRVVSDPITFIDGGVSYNSDITHPFVEQCASLLLTKILVEDGFQKYFNEIRIKEGNQFISHHPFFSSPFINVIKQVKNENNYLYEFFIEKLKEEFDAISRSPLKIYHIISVIPTSYCPNNREYNNSLLKISFLSYSQMIEKYNIENLKDYYIRRYNTEFSELTNYSFIDFEILACDVNFAREIGEKYLDTIISFFTFLSMNGKISRTLMGERQSINIPLVFAFFIFEDTNFSMLFSTKCESFSSIQFPDVNIIQMENFLNSLMICDEKIADVVIRGLNSYYFGISINNPEIGFASLWTSLEIFFLKCFPQVSENKVIRRLKKLLPPNADPEHVATIDQLYEVRNKKIHEAISPNIIEVHYNLLKFYLEFTINYFITNLISKDHNSINAFYDRTDNI